MLSNFDNTEFIKDKIPGNKNDEDNEKCHFLDNTPFTSTDSSEASRLKFETRAYSRAFFKS